MAGAIVELEDNARLDIACFTAARGRKPSRPKRGSTLLNDRCIKLVTADFEEGNISIPVFLRRASRRMQSAFNQCLKIDPPLFNNDQIPDEGEDQNSEIDDDGMCRFSSSSLFSTIFILIFF